MGNQLSCLELTQQDAKDGNVCQQTDNYWQTTADFWRKWWPLLVADTMQWYGFAIYGSMEPWISQNFFNGSSSIGWVVFGLTFAARPFGGVFFGTVADRLGRRPAVLSSLVTMCCATVGQGLTPTVPYLGPTWLLTCRVMQGLAIGGESGSVNVFLSEQSPSNILSMSGHLMMVGLRIGFAASNAVALALLSSLGDDQMLSWGWRVPFLLSIVLGFASIYNAHAIPETHQFEELHQETEEEPGSISQPMQEMKDHWVQGALAITGTASYFTQTYLAGSYLQDWLVTSCGLQQATTFWVLISGQLLAIPVAVPFGWYGDHHGLGKLNVLTASIATLVSLPMYLSLHFIPSSLAVLVMSGVIIPAITIGSGVGTFPWAATLFPTEIRGTALSLYWNLACPIGGIGPAICAMSNNSAFPAYYSTFFGALSVMASAVALHLHAQRSKTGKGYQVSYLREEPY